MRTKEILTLPSETDPIVEETPPFLRALTFASMDTPGALESPTMRAFFNVTLPEPEPTWSALQIEEHMSAFNEGTIVSTAIHEVYPGHYTQMLFQRQASSLTRKILSTNSFVEGWAHYTEQMMLDEGYAQNKPWIRLGQLQDALLRDARFVVAIRMHTQKMSYNDAVQFFTQEGYQTHANAEREVKRGTSDPMYLVYTLGKLRILELREHYLATHETPSALHDFHDALLLRGTFTGLL